ncbi:MAG: efflux RND transporter periplasmic adaptor subunit [Pseudomonadota bacterium]
MSRFNPRILFNNRPAVVLLVGTLAVLWILSGVMTREAPTPESSEERPPMAVAVEERTAGKVERLLMLQGRVEPMQRIVVRAETAGQIAEWAVERGARVEPDQQLARLRMDDREAKRRQAEAEVKGRRSQYEATRRMAEDDFIAELEVDTRRAELEAAQARLEAVELDIANTRIRAPIHGIVNRRLAETGDFVAVGGKVAEVVDNNPLLAVVQVPQNRIDEVASGLPARIRFLDGSQAEGEVTFVAPMADPATRTFRMEVEVPNPDGALPSGLSAEVIVPVEEVRAHRVSPAILSLNDQGELGLMAVADDDTAVFHPVTPVRADADGLWVTGPPERVRLITIGQGFVRPGETVNPRPASALADDKGEVGGTGGPEVAPQ